MERVATRRRAGITIGATLIVVVVTVASRVAYLRGPEVDWDEGVYWLSLLSMSAGHPLFQSVFSSQPPAFLGFTEPLWAVLGGGIGAAREVMLGWWVAAVIAGAWIGWRLDGGVAAVAMATVMCVDPLGVRQSATFQSDGPATALATIALALGVLAVTTPRPRLSLAAAALLGAGFALGELNKLFDVAAVPALLGLLVLAPGGRRRRLILAGLVGGLVAAAAVLLPLAGSLTAVWNQVVGTQLGASGVDYGAPLGSVIRDHSQPLLALAALGLVAAWRRHTALWLIGLLWSAGAVGLLAVLTPLWEHESVIATPGVALLAAAGCSWLVGWLTNHWPGRVTTLGLPVVGAAGAVAILLIAGLGQLAPNRGEPGLVAALERDTPAAGYVLGDGQFYQAEAGRQAPPEFVDTSATRFIGQGIKASDLESAASQPDVCAVLFSSGRLAGVTGFETWVADRFPQHYAVGSGSTLYVMPDCSP